MANDTEKRITAKMILDSSGFNESLQGVNKGLRTAQSELEKANASVGVFGRSSENLKSVQSALAEQVELHSKKVKILKDSLEKTTIKMDENIKERDKLKSSLESANIRYEDTISLYGKESVESKKAKEDVAKLTEELKRKEAALSINAKSIDNYTTNLNKAEKELIKTQGELQKTTKELGIHESKWISTGKTLEDTSAKMKIIGNGMSSVGNKLNLGVTVPLLGIGVAASKIGMDFESAMSRVKAISGATGESFEKLNAQALQLGADTAFSAKEAAGGMENLASAGFSVEEIMKAMPGMLDLAASGGLDIATASDIASSALRAFGLDASQSGHFADVLAKAAADTNAGVTDMGMALKYAAPPAHALGMSIEEVSASIGIMANSGIKGETAGSTLRASLISLASPSKEAATLMERLGFNAFDAQGKMLPFKDVIDKLQKSTKNLTEEKKADALATIFGKESLSGMMTIIDSGPAKFDELTKSFKSSDGAAKEMAKTMQDNGKSSVEQMMGSIETAAIKVEKVLAPTIIKIAEGIQEVANNFSKLSPEVQENIVKIGLLVAAAGPLLSITGKFLSVGGSLVGVAGKLAIKLGLAGVAAERAGVAGVAGTAGITGLGVGLGAAVLAAAPFVLAGVAIAGVGYEVNKAMSQEAIPAIDLFETKMVTTSKSIKDSNGKIIETMETTSTKISDATKKAIESYLKLDNDATKSVSSLYANSTTITKEIATTLTTKFNDMGVQIKGGFDTHFTESYTIMQKFFDKSSTLTTTEETKVLTDMKAKNEAKKIEIDGYTKRITEIWLGASMAKRGITKDEQIELDDIDNKMKASAVKSLSDTELESKVILERMKEYGNRITAEQASEIIKNANTTRDKSIAAANDTYDKTVKAIISQRNDSDPVSVAMSEKLIKDAQNTRDQSVIAAEEMKTDVVKKLKDMNGDILENMNTDSGKIMEGWDKLKQWFINNPIVRWINTLGSETEYKGNGAGGIDRRASGDSYYPGGRTTMHEKGYEVYELNRGSRIYNHEASEDMVMKTAQEVARGVLQSMGDLGSSGPQSIITQVNLDGKVIATVTTPYANKIQGSNTRIDGRAMGVR